MFGGSGVLAAAADTAAASGVFICVGSQLYRVAPTGSIVLVGPVKDSLRGLATVVPSSLVLKGRSGRCNGGFGLHGQLAAPCWQLAVPVAAPVRLWDQLYGCDLVWVAVPLGCASWLCRLAVPLGCAAWLAPLVP